MTLVHELTHALQDQSFDLDRFEKRDPLSDAGTAGDGAGRGGRHADHARLQPQDEPRDDARRGPRS